MDQDVFESTIALLLIEFEPMNKPFIYSVIHFSLSGTKKLHFFFHF